MERWIPHNYIDRHQTISRNRSIENVKNASAGTRLVILSDWSATLPLEPNHGGTAATYRPVGVLCNIVLYKSPVSLKLECVSHPVVCESAAADVQNTHAGLEKVLAHYGARSRPAGTFLHHVHIYSDGGPKHFRNTQGLVMGVHLEAYVKSMAPLRLRDIVRCVWSFMESYHGTCLCFFTFLCLCVCEYRFHPQTNTHIHTGKGPYDPEGGIVKYYVRRQIRIMGRAFANAFEVMHAHIHPQKHKHTHT